MEVDGLLLLDVVCYLFFPQVVVVEARYKVGGRITGHSNTSECC